MQNVASGGYILQFQCNNWRVSYYQCKVCAGGDTNCSMNIIYAKNKNQVGSVPQRDMVAIQEIKTGLGTNNLILRVMNPASGTILGMVTRWPSAIYGTPRLTHII